MPKIHVSRSIRINAPKEKIKEFLVDFNNWPSWSPWLVCEPEVAIEFADEGRYYKWDGKRVGSGEMKVIAEHDNQIDYDLMFLKPWKSKAKVNFKLTATAQGTLVEWIMDSAIPFFMFWMKTSMEVYIGMDYERGLKMLKETLEEGKIHSQLEFIGHTNFEGCQYIGIKTRTAFSKIGAAMEKDFTSLHEYMTTHNIDVAGHPFSEYQKMNLVKDNVVYVVGFPVKEIPKNLPDNMLSGRLPKCTMYTVRHIGKYDHLGNAWSAVMMMERQKEFKKHKKAYPIETYINNPNDTPPKELIADISIPLA